MEAVDYFHLIVFGCLLVLVITATTIIVRLANKVTELSYELKLGKINCQKDLDRLEDKINRFSNQSNLTESKYSKDIEKLDELVKTLNKTLDSKINNTKNIDNNEI